MLPPNIFQDTSQQHSANSKRRFSKIYIFTAKMPKKQGKKGKGGLVQAAEENLKRSLEAKTKFLPAGKAHSKFRTSFIIAHAVFLVTIVQL